MIEYLLEDLPYSKENPILEIWDLFEEAISESEMNSSPLVQYSKKNINQMNKLYKQGKELFYSSDALSIYSSPLSLFYGCSNLTKALLMHRDNKKSLEKLQPSHGLEFLLNGSDIRNRDIFKVKIGEKGTFIELLQSFERSQDISCFYDQTISLNDLILRYVDIFDNLKPSERTEQLPVAFFKIFHHDPKPNMQIGFFGNDTEENFNNIKKNFPKIGFDLFEDTNIRISSLSHSDKKAVHTSSKEKKDLPPILHHKSFDKQEFLFTPIETTDQKLYFHQEEIQYMIAFIFSNLVRYYAHIWIDLVETSEFLILKKALRSIYRSFPNYILNRIKKKNHIVFTPGILTR